MVRRPYARVRTAEKKRAATRFFTTLNAYRNPSSCAWSNQWARTGIRPCNRSGTQRFERVAATRAVLLGGQMYALFTFEVIRQRFATGTLAALLRLLCVSLSSRTFAGLQIFKPQLQLLDLDRAETELVLQFDYPLCACMSRHRMCAHQRLQRINVVAQVGIGQIHCDDLVETMMQARPVLIDDFQ